MKKLRKKYRVIGIPHDLSAAGQHIHLLHIRAFASEGAHFTEQENGHFDVCRDCRLKVIDALRNLDGQVVHTIASKAA